MNKLILPFLFSTAVWGFVVKAQNQDTNYDIAINNTFSKSDKSERAPTDSDYQDKVAILPVSLITDFPTDQEELAYRIQLECYNLVTEKAKTLQYLSPVTTNALLLKRGITNENIKQYTTEELCELLGVTYVIQNLTSIYTSGGVRSTKRTSSSENGQKSTDISSTETITYTTRVLLNIYSNDGKLIYGKDRESMWPTQDGYRKTLQYLAKRTPLYKK